jgi:hypothetical protein
MKMRQEAALLATLFLNFAFWEYHGNALWLPYPLPISILIIAAVSAFLTLCFLTLPALAAHRHPNGLFGAVESSLGTFPAHTIRLCAIWFVATFLNTFLALASWQLPHILHRDTDSRELLLSATLLLAFLGYTALQSHETNVTLAKFTNRLGIAFLLAAAIRLHEAWPQALPILLSSGPERPGAFDYQRLSRLAFDLAPLGFLGAACAARIDTEKNTIRTTLLGFAFPLGAVLLALSSINLATFHSSFYRPSLEPTIAMAVWGGAATSYLSGFILITIVTTFGAARFAIRAIPAAMPNPRLHLLAVVTTLAIAIAIFLWRQLLQQQLFPPEFEPSSVILAIAAAILSADALHRRPTTPKRIDWPATAALLLAFAVAYGISQSTHPALESWWRPWIFPSYLTAFTITLAGRKLQKTRIPTNQPQT